MQYAKRVVGRKMYGGQASYIPIKVNMSGVMPIIFASTLCSLPGMIFRFINIDAAAHPLLYGFFSAFNYNSVLYLVVYVLLIVAFNYFYVAIQYNPVDIANQLRKNNGTIPGIRPGKPPVTSSPRRCPRSPSSARSSWPSSRACPSSSATSPARPSSWVVPAC